MVNIYICEVYTPYYLSNYLLKKYGLYTLLEIRFLLYKYGLYTLLVTMVYIPHSLKTKSSLLCPIINKLIHVLFLVVFATFQLLNKALLFKCLHITVEVFAT